MNKVSEIGQVKPKGKVCKIASLLGLLEEDKEKEEKKEKMESGQKLYTFLNKSKRYS